MSTATATRTLSPLATAIMRRLVQSAPLDEILTTNETGDQVERAFVAAAMQAEMIRSVASAKSFPPARRWLAAADEVLVELGLKL